MTPPIDHAAAWKAMSEPEKNIWFLQKFFSPKAKPYCLSEYEEERAKTYMWYWIPSGKPRRTHEIDSRPIPDFLADWNHWRSVEMKVMEDEDIFDAYISEMMAEKELGHCCVRLVANDLPARAKALYLAFHSLPH